MRKLEVGMEGSHMDFAVIERFEVLVRDWME